MDGVNLRQNRLCLPLPFSLKSLITGSHSTSERGALNQNDRDKTVTEPLVLRRLGLASSEKQVPQVVENLGSGENCKEALE
jgi:hypothetical protein